MEKTQAINSLPSVDVSNSENHKPPIQGHENGSVTLIPRLSNDPLNPQGSSQLYNFPAVIQSDLIEELAAEQEIRILAALSLATFSEVSACLVSQLQAAPQSKLYKVATPQIVYRVIALQSSSNIL